MANVRRQSFRIEAFTYSGRAFADPRQRTVSVVALLRAGMTQAPTVRPAPARNVPGDCLSMLGARVRHDDDRGNDFFLPLFDAGHLLGAQYGGGTDSYNLVPMLRGRNRGGAWNAFETDVTKYKGAALLAIKCIYPVLGDPRIPIGIEAAFIPVDGGSGQTLDDEWAQWEPSLHALIKNIGAGKLAQSLPGKLQPRIVSIAAGIRQCLFAQEEFATSLPPYPLANPRTFRIAFLTALQFVDNNGWRVERDGRAPFEATPDAVDPTMAFTPRYRLPSLIDRPYAALDYMSLTGALDNVLVGADNTKHNITSRANYNAISFNPAMRSLAMHANLILNEFEMQGQFAYCSDARAHLLHPDPGTAGDGVVLTPEFDHIIPCEPADDGLRGPTVFSNLNLVSPRYNGQKKNNMWVQPAFTVGMLRQVMQNTRLKRPNESHDGRRGDDDKLLSTKRTGTVNVTN